METHKGDIKYINGLKGFACLMVMVGHYFGLYKYAEEFPYKFVIFDKIFNSKIGFLTSESFWLYLFFVISGYLVSQSSVKSISQLVKRIIFRFLRLGIPILFSTLLIYILLYKGIGFFNQNIDSMISNAWFQGYYNTGVDLKSVLISPVLVLVNKEVVLNPPYWCLSSMFIAAALIYLYTYISERIKKPYWFYAFVILLLGTLHFGFDGARTACIVGVLAYVVLNDKLYGKELIHSKLFCLVMLFISILINVYYERLIIASIFVIFLIFSGKCEPVNKLLSSSVFQWLGRLSWGVYSFHFPIFCSIGMIIMLNLIQRGVSVFSAYIMIMGTSVFITLFFSIIYYFVFDMLTNKLLKRVKSLMRL